MPAVDSLDTVDITGLLRAWRQGDEGALERLMPLVSARRAMSPRRHRVSESDRSVEETGEVLQLSPQTVMRDWRLARAWLARELRGERPAKV